MQQTLHYSALRSGVAFLPFTVGIIAGAMLSTQILPRVGAAHPDDRRARAGLRRHGAADLPGPGHQFLDHVLPAELVISFGMGTVFGPLTSTALVGVADHDAGVASALVNAVQQIGGSLGTALLNTIFVSALTGYVASNAINPQADPAGLMAATVHGYTVAFWVSAALMAAAAVIAAVAIRVRPEQLASSQTAHVSM